jgi:uncharacterized protein YggE
MAVEQSTISVVGNGLIETEANILTIWITAYKVTDTIKQSQEEVNNVVNDIINILKENNIPKKNIHTTSIEFEPNYTWENNSKKYTGQKVEQVLVCVIDNLKNNLKKVTNILDTITVNNNSIKLTLDFGIKEDKEMEIKCRELAYQDGLEKAKKYAELSGLKIVKALTISEREISSRYHGRASSMSMFCKIGSSPTNLPLGTVEHSMDLYIDFLAE